MFAMPRDRAIGQMTMRARQTMKGATSDTLLKAPFISYRHLRSDGAESLEERLFKAEEAFRSQ